MFETTLRSIFGAGLLVVLVAGCSDGGEGTPSTSSRAAPPDMPVTGAEFDPGLARLLRGRTTSVRRSEAGAEAWGQLGIAYDAHTGFDGDFTVQAIDCYREAAALAPMSFRWPYLIGTLLYVTDQQASLEWFDRALEAEGGAASAHAPLHVRRGRGRLALGLVVEAEADFAKAVALDGKLVQGWMGMARVHLANDDADAGLKALEKATAAGPVTDEIHGLYAEVYRRLGDAELAAAELELMQDGGLREPIPDLLRAEVEAEGVSVAWGRSRTKMLLEVQRTEDAVLTWRRVIEGGEQVGARLGLAELFIGLGRLEEAEATHGEITAQGVAGAPEKAEVMFQKGVIALARRDDEAAAEAFKAVLSVDPAHDLARGNLGLAMFELGQREEGLELVRTAAIALGAKSRMQFNYIKVLERAQAWPELELALDALASEQGESGYTRYTRGRVLAGMRRYDEAVQAFDSVLEFEPLNELAITNAARAERKLGSEERAFARLRASYERLTSPEVRMTAPQAGLLVAKELAWTLSTVPDDALAGGAEAVALAKRVLAQAPSNAELLDLIGAAEAANGNFEAAVAHASAALEVLDVESGETTESVRAYVKEIEARLAKYRAGTRWRR